MEPILGIVGDEIYVHINHSSHVSNDHNGEEKIGEERFELLGPVPTSAGPSHAFDRGKFRQAGRKVVANPILFTDTAHRR